MGLEIVRQLNVDFHDAKYISINAKQYDKASRFILITCCNQGVITPIENDSNYAFIRYRKPDSLGVFNSCKITDEGKILIELTEQMLSTIGKSDADLVIVHNESGSVDVDISTGEIIVGNGSSILSTMHFYINVIESSLDNTEIESSYEYDALNDLLIKATADYTNVINAVKVLEENAKLSETNAKTSEINAKTSETNAKISENNANASELSAKESENMATVKATESSQFASNSAQSAIEAANSAKVSTDKADESSGYAVLSQSYAVGGTNTRENEDTDNSKYYYSKTKNISDTLGGLFLPKGTIEFSQLQSVDKGAGYVYHIKNDFTSDNTFKDGGGVLYPAGTNVYCTSDGYWDCFVGGNLTVTDDDNGNVEFVYVNLYDIQSIVELQSRIEALEKQTTLEITE